MTVKYSKEHEWLRLDGDTATIGITDYAQEQLGDIVYVDSPEVGMEFKKNAEIAVVESVKAASEIYVPVGGVITEVNPLLEDCPSTINVEPEGKGWLIKMTVADAAELDDLLDLAAYKQYVESLE